MVSKDNPEGQDGEDEEPVKYEELVIEEPERVIEEGTYEAGKSVSEATEEGQQQSDLKAVLSYLHPTYKDRRLNEVAQSVMASRIFPDNFLDKNYLLVMSLIEEKAAAGEDVDFMGLISAVQDFTSIAYEGRGRVEDLEVAGVIHEEELEKLSKELLG